MPPHHRRKLTACNFVIEDMSANPVSMLPELSVDVFRRGSDGSDQSDHLCGVLANQLHCRREIRVIGYHDNLIHLVSNRVAVSMQGQSYV